MKFKMIGKYGLFTPLFFISSCSLLSTHQIHEKSQQVNVVTSYDQVKNCQFVGELVGTEGKWYNYFFISNRELTTASMNDLKNQANTIGASHVYIKEKMEFATSVTFIGQAYSCKDE